MRWVWLNLACVLLAFPTLADELRRPESLARRWQGGHSLRLSPPEAHKAMACWNRSSRTHKPTHDLAQCLQGFRGGVMELPGRRRGVADPLRLLARAPSPRQTRGEGQLSANVSANVSVNAQVNLSARTMLAFAISHRGSRGDCRNGKASQNVNQLT